MSWPTKLQSLLPTLRLPAGTLILHGSTTAGVDDQWSDLDVWLLLPGSVKSEFIEFTCEGKKGHVNIESQSEFQRRIRTCDFPLIYELRRSVQLGSDAGWYEFWAGLTRRPMPEDVRQAWFACHYIEMRGEHRACDNPINRGESIALLLALQPTLTHAMQAAMVLDGEPYPYSKWLASAAARTPTGARIVPLVQDVVDLVGAGSLRHRAAEGSHPLNLKLKQIRQVLVDAAKASGLDAPWLKDWYLHLELRRDLKDLIWD